MPGSAARRIDTLAVQFFGDGAARDARALETFNDPIEIRRARRGFLLDLGDSFNVAGLLAPKGASAVGVAELDPACFGGGQSVLCALSSSSATAAICVSRKRPTGPAGTLGRAQKTKSTPLDRNIAGPSRLLCR
jgi:hypothetical protein